MGIKLLYIWNGNFGNSSLYNKGFIINSKYYVEYNHNNGTIYIEKNENYIPDFWGNSITDCFRFLYKGIIINHNKKLSQPTLKRRFFKKKAAFFSWPGLGKEWC